VTYGGGLDLDGEPRGITAGAMGGEPDYDGRRDQAFAAKERGGGIGLEAWWTVTSNVWARTSRGHHRQFQRGRIFSFEGSGLNLWDMKPPRDRAATGYFNRRCYTDPSRARPARLIWPRGYPNIPSDRVRDASTTWRRLTALAVGPPADISYRRGAALTLFGTGFFGIVGGRRRQGQEPPFASWKAGLAENARGGLARAHRPPVLFCARPCWGLVSQGTVLRGGEGNFGRFWAVKPLGWNRLLRWVFGPRATVDHPAGGALGGSILASLGFLRSWPYGRAAKVCGRAEE